MAKTRITFPDGTTVDIDKDTPPAQIQAIITSLNGVIRRPSSSQSNDSSGQIIEPDLSAKELWEQGSQKEKLAIFIRNHFLPTDWFTTKQVRDQQLEFVKKFVFGESPAISTYLNRLHDEGYVDKSKRGKLIHYQLRDQILSHYPELQLQEISELLRSEL